MKYPTVRTTLDKIGEVILPTPAVYILAYMGKIVYVGKAENSVEQRLSSHRTCAQRPSESLGKWIIKNADHSNIRLDILSAPDGAPFNWAREMEAKCIRRFRPLLNTQLNH